MMSPQGMTHNQVMLGAFFKLLLLYAVIEGFDERMKYQQWSLWNYVLTGGEMGMAVTDSVVRLLEVMKAAIER